MNSKQSKLLRKLIGLMLDSEGRKKLQTTEIISLQEGGVKAIIDGVKGEIRTEEYNYGQLFSDESIRLYRKLKKEYNNPNSEIGKSLRADMKKLETKSNDA